MTDDGARARLGALDADRRWRWLLAGWAVPAILGLFAMLFLPVVATVLVYRFAAGLGLVFRWVLAAVSGLAVMLTCTLGVPFASRTRPWLLLVGAVATPSRNGRRPMDAAGLVRAAYGAAGVALADTAAEQYRQTRTAAVDVSDLRPGDLMFWAATLSAGPMASENVRIFHVAIYLGHDDVVSASPAGSGVGVRAIRTEEATLDAILGSIRGERHFYARLHAATRPSAVRDTSVPNQGHFPQ